VNGFHVCDNHRALLLEIFGVLHLAFQRTADIAGQNFWWVAVVAVAGAIGSVSRADAAYYYYYPNSDPTYYRPAPEMQPRRPVVRHQAKKEKDVVAAKETGAKPQGALTIVVSINKQQVKIYDTNGFFAEAPVSTGMKGHPTPMGVFSVIQKQKWHHSNIYSGAPMPYMQRITWSGIAMHAGVLPGYPASHGCIRMPEAFAIKMYGWTRMSARVLVTPGEVSPARFTHPLLPSMKVVPAQVSADERAAPQGVKADKGAADKAPEVVETKLELRPSVDHGDATSPDGASTNEKTRTADAGGGLSTDKAPATMSDASSAAKDDATVDLATPKAAAGNNDVKADAPKTGPKAGDAKTEVKPAEPAKAGEALTPAQKPAAKADAASDAKKDETRQPDIAKAAAAKAEAAKRAGQIAVFISRKDSKLYVRQNFEPLFNSPVTIAPSDRPLGTHVFTAEIDKNDPNILHWSVVSLPVSARGLVHEDEPRSAMRRKGAKSEPVEAKAPPAIDSPAEALDRITIPADVMARITDALTTGGSIIVSDQGINQGETGEGTDFIVSLR
jgi:lipoprotein-anchoring transpeptidase ErfK/SrfK